jgi:hypothetical protein
MKKLFILLLIAITFSSCFQNLFKVQTSNAWSKSHIDSLKHSNKTVVVHFQNGIKTMSSPAYDSIKITGGLAEYRKLYKREDLPTYPMRVNAYKKRHRNIVFGQAHVYVTDDFNGQNSIAISKENFVRTNIYAHDVKATTTNHIVSVGIIVALIALNVLALADMGVGGFELFSMYGPYGP